MMKFVIHEHDAQRAGLHHDLRITIDADNIAKGWALPKLTPTSKEDGRRLAVKSHDVHVDHMYFEGVIPKGEYGAGNIYVWDRGDAELIFGDGKQYFINFRGNKIKGNYYIRHWEGDKWLIWKN